MRADEVEASWDPGKNKWLLRIRAGEEVTRRHCDSPKDADDSVLKSAIRTVMVDEGYEEDPIELKILR